MATLRSFFLYLLVFLTGAAGLVYQVVWQQYLARILGSEHAATAIVLAVFLGGLAAGYLISGALSRWVKNSFAAYAVLEGVIGVWALIFPWLFWAVDSMTARWSFSPPFFMILQGTLTAAVLIGLPTMCMGGTVPLLTRALSETLDESTSIHARVYAINTLGAFVGAISAGFLLVPALGLPDSLSLAACLNLLAAGYFAFRAKRAVPQIRPPEEQAMESAPRRYPVGILYTVAFLSGAYVMTLENVLIRVADLAMGSSTYSFSLIVGVFVLCIGTGSLIIGGAKRLSPRALIWNQVLLTLAMLCVFTTLDKWPYAAHLLRIGFQSNIVGFWWHKLGALIVLGLLLAVPIGLAGATLPIAFHELRRNLDRVGWYSGLLFFWNLLGAVAGSLIGGWLLYVWMGNGRIFLAAVSLAGISAVVAGFGRSWRWAAAAVLPLIISIVMLIKLPFHDPSHFAVGTFRHTAPFAETWKGPTAFYKSIFAALNILYYHDGPGATVAVVESKPEPPAATDAAPVAASAGAEPPGRSIFVNGKSDSNTLADRETLKLLAEFGALFSQKRERALLIGLGTGVSVGELALHDEWKEISVAELLPGVAAALPLFSDATNRVQDDPRLRMRLGDAFRVLRRTPQTWDIIVSEPSNLWVRGIGQLFSREFYAIAKSRLAPGGVFVQWMQGYAVNAEILGRVGTTLRSEFKHVAAFRGTQYDFLFVATADELSDVHYDRAMNRMAENQRVRDSLQQIGVATKEDFARRRLRGAFLEVQGVYPETLDQPRLHYLAGQAAFVSDPGSGRP